MNQAQQRVVQEKAELDEKIGKLENFIQSGQRQPISECEYTLLQSQLTIMQEYSKVLGQRMKLWEQQKDHPACASENSKPKSGFVQSHHYRLQSGA